MLDLLLLIPGLPLLAAMVIASGLLLGWGRGEESESSTVWLATGATFLSCVLVIGVAVARGMGELPAHVELAPWFHSGDYRVAISFTLDRLSLSVAGIFALIVWLVTRFAVNYLHREAGFQRFFLVLCVFAAAMQGIVLAGNALLTFVGWELAGVSSYLLISYNWQSTTATANATRAFVTNRLGDAGFLLGLFMAFTWFHSTEWVVLLAPSSHVPSLMVGITALGLMTAALVKSAQFPFSAWITRALEGPTPSSAVFYGAVMVHAGIYLLLRIHPLLEQAPALQYLLLLLGGLTVLYGWLGGMVQTDIKTSLLFSTLTQTGLMVLAIAWGWYDLAWGHLLLHAIWRTYQFLHSPSFALHTQWQAAPPAPAWLQQRLWLRVAALQRFWLDPLTDWLFVKPTVALSQELHIFDEQILDKLSGTPAHHTGISTLAEMQAYQQGKLHLSSAVGRGSGLFGNLLQWLAEQMEWLEKHLLLQHDGGKTQTTLLLLGRYLDRVDRLLTQPRYLVLLVAVTLVVIF